MEEGTEVFVQDLCALVLLRYHTLKSEGEKKVLEEGWSLNRGVSQEGDYCNS